MTSTTTLHRLAWALGTALLFGLLCFGGLALTQGVGHLVAIWPANAVLLALMMLAPRHDRSLRLTAALCANLVANLAAGLNPALAALHAASNLVEMLVAVQVMELLPDVQWSKLESPRTLFAFMLGTGIVPPAVSGLIAAIGTSHFTGESVGSLFTAWFGAHAGGLLVIAPPVALLLRDGFVATAVERRKPMVIALAVVVAVSFGVFSQTNVSYLFLCLPPLVLAAMAGGFRSASVALLMVAAIGTVETLLGNGPMNELVGLSPAQQVLHLQVFLGVAVGMTLPLSSSLHERTRLESMLRQQAMTDALTQVASRAKLNEVLPVLFAGQSRRRAPVSVAILDIDFFKQYNDRYGHLQGDACLKEVAKVLRESFPRGSDLVARYGGEEFVVVMPDTTAENAALATTRLHSALAAANLKHEGSHLGRVSVSVGVASCVPGRSDTPESLLEQADAQLYLAKRSGRARTMVQGSDVEVNNVISLGAFRLQQARAT